MTIEIKDWKDNFENSETRKYKSLKWIPIPNKHDGKGFGRLRHQENRVELFCGWCLLIQIASKMPERGILKDEDGDLTTEDMEFMTGFPSSIFKKAIRFFSDKKIGWITISEDIRKFP